MAPFNKEFLQSKHFKVGLPLVVFVIVASFGLKEFTSLRYDFRQARKIDDPELLKRMKPRGSVTLESEYEKIKQLDIDNWSNIRGPRLFEEKESK